MSSSKSVNLYTGTALARLELAKRALRPNIIDLADPEGRDHPVVYGVIVADGGTLYTYTRGDHGGLAETVETVVGLKQPVRGDVPDWLQDLDKAQIAEWEAMQPPPHPDAGTELAPNVEDSLVEALDETVEPKKGAGRPSADFDREKARRMIHKGIRPKEVAGHFGLSEPTIRKAVKGVKPFAKFRKNWDRIGAYEAVMGGESFTSTAKRFGVVNHTLIRLVDYIDGEAR